MSSGGIFKLMINEGMQDKLLLASKVLHERIKKIKKFNINRANLLPVNLRNTIDLEKSYLPDINAIDMTHMIIVNGSFKPFVSAGFEYNRVQSNGEVKLGQTASFILPVYGDFINDAVVHVKMSGLKAVSPLDRVRYVAFPGHKLLKKVEFKINSNPLDNYVSDDYNAHYQFNVPPGKRVGWMRNVGQEIPHRAFLTGDPVNDLFREYKLFGDGFQTPKQKHDDLEMWIPLLFWFNDIKSALPSALIPYGQTQVIINLANATELVGFSDYGGGGEYIEPKINVFELYMNNIFMNPEIVNIFTKKFGFLLVRVHVRHIQRLFNSEGSVHLNGLKWPVETIYATFRPKDNSSLSQYWNNGSVLTLKEIKTPVIAQNTELNVYGDVTNATNNTATITRTSGMILSAIDDYYVGYTFGITGGTGYNSHDITLNNYTVTAYDGTNNIITINGEWLIEPNTSTTYELFTPQLAINVSRYYKESPVIDTIEIKAHNIVIYRKTNESFYNSYLPLRFGHGNTPYDRGWYMINFGFQPEAHQPQGHINLTKAREFYLNYTSSFISDENETTMGLYAKAINFVLVKNGTTVLRYST